MHYIQTLFRPKSTQQIFAVAVHQKSKYFNTFIRRVFLKFYEVLFAPRMIMSEQLRRREYMTNVLLAGLSTLFFIRLILTITTPGERGILLNESSWLVNTALLLIVFGYWRWSRMGHVQAAALGVISLLLLQALSLVVQWGFEFPFALLMITVVILASGVLLTPRYAISITVLVAASVLIINRAQSMSVIAIDTRWTSEPFTSREAIGLLGVMAVIAVVTWIMNLEMNNSIARMTESEAALEVERDKLEERVQARTEQIEKIQLTRNLELQRFAEFGRLSANLLHEISNPLTAAYLNLATYEGKDSQAIYMARKNLKQLERYTLAARSQLKQQGTIRLFSIRSEVQKTRLILDPIASNASVKIDYQIDPKIKLMGDPVKFSQIVTNIIVNAIDSYESLPLNAVNRRILLHIHSSSGQLTIAVRDYGIGMPESTIENIFTPFYSTKNSSGRGLGIGLPMVKRMIAEDFNGTIAVTSIPLAGTTFTATIPLSETMAAKQ